MNAKSQQDSFLFVVVSIDQKNSKLPKMRKFLSSLKLLKKSSFGWYIRVMAQLEKDIYSKIPS